MTQIYGEKNGKDFEGSINTQFGRPKLGVGHTKKWVATGVNGQGCRLKGEMATNISILNEYSFLARGTMT